MYFAVNMHFLRLYSEDVIILITLIIQSQIVIVRIVIILMRKAFAVTKISLF